MGWLSDTYNRVATAVTNVTSPIINGVGQIASGNVSEGLGDIGETLANMGLDIATGGNKDIVDQYTGGLMSSAESAARGNSKDIARVGITGAAAVYGGPVAAAAVNQAFASGANAFQAAGQALGAVGESYGVPNLGDIASRIAGNRYPEPGPVSGPERAIMSPSISNDNTTMIIGIVAGVAVLILTIFLVKKKGKK